MESPYLRFVKVLASLIGGRYPEHYDSLIKKKIRYLWVVGIPLLTSIAYFRADTLATGILIPSDLASSPTSLGITVVMVILAGLSWRVASLRSQSIEKYVLETNTERVLTEDSSETAQDAIHLSEYLKTYFALAGIMHADVLVSFILPTGSKLLPVITYLLFLPSLYYAFVLLDLLMPLLFRWGRQHIQNDKDSTSSQSSADS